METIMIAENPPRNDPRATLLPIREAYEWKQKTSVPASLKILLPIREAYEWKLIAPRVCMNSGNSCFQFVKRMNGNSH
jgi:hypothetical protein